MWRGSPVVEAVYVNRLLTGSLPQALPPTEPHRSYAAPEQLLSCSVNKSKPWCNVRSNSIYVGYSNKCAQGKKTTVNVVGRRLHPYCFVQACLKMCLFKSSEKQHDHLVWLASTKLVYQFVTAGSKGKSLSA